VIEVVALAGALADAGEDRIAAMRLGDVVDQLHDDDGLADAGAAEQPDLAALGIWRQQIDDFDAGDEDLGLGRLVEELRRRLVDRRAAVGVDRTALIDRVADDIQDAAQRLRAYRHRDRAAGVDDLGAAHQAVGRIHSDRAHDVLAQMLRHFEHERAPRHLDMQRGQDGRQFAVEMHIDDRADDLLGGADRVPGHLFKVPRWRHRERSEAIAGRHRLHSSRLLRRSANDMG
jgi:peptide chain release factor 1